MKKSRDKQIVGTDQVTIEGITLRKMTAGTFTLCDMANLSLVKGGTEHELFEMLAFLWIHNVDSQTARSTVFDLTMGEDSKGRSLLFVNTVMDWADNIPVSAYAKLAQTVGDMIEDSFKNAVVPDEKNEGNK